MIKEAHSRLHEERLRILNEVKRAQKQQQAKSHKFVPHKSAVYEVVLKRDQKQRLKLVQKEKKKKELINRRKKYGEYVKQFVNNPSQYYSDEELDDADVYEDNDDEPTDRLGEKSGSALHGNYHSKSQDRAHGNSQKNLHAAAQLDPITGKTVRVRRQIHSHLQEGSLLPANMSPKSREVPNLKAQAAAGGLALLRPNRNIKSEYKSQFVDFKHNENSEPVEDPHIAKPWLKMNRR